MKNLIVITLLIASFCGCSHVEHNYTLKECRVIEASTKGALIEDKSGNTWYFEAEGFKVDEVVNMKMHDNFTSGTNEDDIITKVIKK